MNTYSGFSQSYPTTAEIQKNDLPGEFLEGKGRILKELAGNYVEIMIGRTLTLIRLASMIVQGRQSNVKSEGK